MNNFGTFMPSQFEQPRMNVISNFKEISRILTGNFLKQKELQAKIKNKTMDQDEINIKKLEDQCTNDMVHIMKKL